jgi:hypothetical protein
MRRIIMIAVLAAIAVLATAAVATADTVSTASNCTPVFAHTEYKWVPDVTNAGPTQWTKEDAAAGTKTTFPWKGQNVAYHRDGTKSQFIDSVTCAVSEPMIPVTTSSVTVPKTPGIDTFLYGVNGHPETEAITSDVTVKGSLDGAFETAPQFWIGYKAQPGYVITNPGAGTNHIDFYNGDDVLDYPAA